LRNNRVMSTLQQTREVIQNIVVLRRTDDVKMFLVRHNSSLHSTNFDEEKRERKEKNRGFL